MYACIFLAIGIANQAFPAENASKKNDSERTASDYAQSKPNVELKPITIIGDNPTLPAADTKSTVLKGRALHIQQNDTLGRTLERELGVSNASFGPGVGVPVIRGLTGSRVRTLQNGIGSHDAASLSPDHAVAIEPLFAEQIRVLRGPETIRYGGNAIGGVVDVIDNRIPERAPKNQIDGAVDNRYDTNGNGTNSAIKLNLGKNSLALSLGGLFRQRNDIRTPGKAINEAFLQQFDANEFQNSTGKIPNTDSQVTSGFAGISWLGTHAMAGMSISHITNHYGVPSGTHGEHEHAVELNPVLPRSSDSSSSQPSLSNIRLNMHQSRYDFKTEWYEPIRGIERIIFRYGLVDYQHREIESSQPFTLFKNNAGEGRFEIDHKLSQQFTGTLGAQWISRDFSASGVETYVPKTKQQSLGFYTTHKYTWNDWIFSAGMRGELSSVNPKIAQQRLDGNALPPVNLPNDFHYQAISASTAAQWNPFKDMSVLLSLNRGKRSPDIQELLALGPHLATRSFDIGNIELGNETTNMIDLSLNWQTRYFSTRVNGYYNHINNFIYQRNTGSFYEIDSEEIHQSCVDAAECVNILAYDQRNAVFTGYEAEIKTMYPVPQGDFSMTVFSDYTRGRFTQGNRDSVPRMPPLRYGFELGFSNNVWNAALRYTRGEAQNHPGENEIRTHSYHLLTANLDYQLKMGRWGDLWLFAKASNLLNDEIRNSVSFLRNFAPEPGRSFIFGVRATF
ncbi:iron complex outermembrane recepter protein [Nitrosomonas sp. PY1]|uniref:TonB-dependent receptor n=1 Tax=Nitrosomonas sp. PY1 TaxID=1803906 RepID=UPI001FC7F0F0|nr:TonB-dependent receptor [Nitrosomonas sp. PY1]GKS70021.1 iron complex outermembrane recepter protein [Nitrosomonas sp. PY1]